MRLKLGRERGTGEWVGSVGFQENAWFWTIVGLCVAPCYHVTQDSGDEKPLVLSPQSFFVGGFR